MRFRDWVSDVCSSDLPGAAAVGARLRFRAGFPVRAADGEQAGARILASVAGAADLLIDELGDKLGDSGRIGNILGNPLGFDRLQDARDLGDRMSVEAGKKVSIRVDLGGRRNSQKKKKERK